MLRNATPKTINRFSGLNSYEHLENLAADFWLASNNVGVNAKGSAEVLRSSKGFNTPLGFGNPVISMAAYINPFEARLLFDINASSGSNVNTYKIENNFTNTLLRSAQSALSWVSLVANGQLYRVNPNEFIQHTVASPGWPAWDVFTIGITPPVAAPTISYVAGGTGQIQNGIQVSYSYMNSRTGHVSIPCPISNRLAASAVNQKTRVPTVASAQHGVDKIVFFFTVDGGSQPFLLIDSNGNMITVANATANNDIDIGTLNWDTLTPQPIFNNLPPAGANFMFQWKNKIFIMGFPGPSPGTADVAYSALESCYIGQPGESWPPLNIVSIPNKGEIARGGIATQLGALFLSNVDGYLLEGFPSDKTSGPEASTAVSEVLLPLNWKIGTNSPRTIKNTPFGTIWLDDAQRLRRWTGASFPDEVGLPLRAELANISSASIPTAEAAWFQFGKSGGVYVLAAQDSVSSKQKLYFMSMYQDPENGNTLTGYGISDIPGVSLCSLPGYNGETLFMGDVNKVDTIFLPTQAGDGWPGGTQIFFDFVLGNDINYAYWHSMRIDCDGLPLDINGNLTGVTITVRDVVKDGSGNTAPAAIGTARTITLNGADAETEGSLYGLIDEYGHRKVFRFAFDATSDVNLRQIKNLTVFYGPKKRVI